MSTPPVNLVADRYRLVEPLGQGGMGRVWKARDDVLHRDVAIKELVPPSGLTEDERREMRERSLREARAIAQLSNIHVVRVFDVLRTDGDPWIVMEYVPSRSLQHVLDTEGPVSPVRAAEIGLGILSALHAAHRAGVVHRDVKPSNVLLGEDGRVVLTDFGLATIPGDPTVTRGGLVLGSPAYIAPERARDGHAGPEADLWSLGATLFAAVEGHSPYARPSAIGTLAALASEPVPVAKNAGQLRPVLTGLLRKDPAQRISADDADRLLRRAAGRRGRGLSLLEGVRLPSSFRDRERRTRVVPAPRPPDASPQNVAGGAAVAEAAGAEAPEVAAPTERVSAQAAVIRPVESGATPTREGERARGSVPPPVFGVPTTADATTRRRWLIMAVVALLALGFVLAVALLDRNPSRDRAVQPGPATPTATSGPTAESTSSAPEPTASPPGNPPAQSPPAPSAGQGQTGQPGPTGGTGQGTSRLLAGWQLHQDETGFQIRVPPGWRESRAYPSYGVTVTFTDPNGPGKLLIDQTNNAAADALADWQRQEPNRKNLVQDYRLVEAPHRIQTQYEDAADWDWTQTSEGQRVYVRNRNIRVSDKLAYSIRWETPVAQWSEAQFEAIFDSFRPRS